MRIGIDVTPLRVARGGVYWYQLNLLRVILQADYSNEYVLVDYAPVRSRRGLPEDLTDLTRPGVRIATCAGLPHRQLARWRIVERLGLGRLAALVDSTLLRPWAAAAESSMRRALDRHLGRVDVFHSSAIVRWRPPCGMSVITMHDMGTRVLPDGHSPADRAVQEGKHEFARSGADVVVTLSEHTKREVVAYLGIDPNRIRKVPGGVEDRFQPVEDRGALEDALAPFGIGPGQYVLHVGTVAARKNLSRLVDAYAQVRHFLERPYPKLVFAGARGYRSREVDHRVRAHDLDRDVVFLDEVPCALLPALYSGACLLAYPSLYEGFGLPPLEAMACGTPVIASDVGAIKEVVGRAGMLVDPYDAGAIGRALRLVLTDARRRSEMSTAGLERSNRFTWEAAGERLLDLYMSAHSGASRRRDGLPVR